MEEKIDRLVVELLDLIDSYAGVQQVIAKRSADIMYLLAREKFHVRGGSERLNVLLFDRRPHRATLKCIQEETTRNGLDSTELCIASKDDSSSVNIIQWFPVNEVQEDSEAQLDTFCLSRNLKEAKRLSENLTSLTLEVMSPCRVNSQS